MFQVYGAMDCGGSLDDVNLDDSKKEMYSKQLREQRSKSQQSNIKKTLESTMDAQDQATLKSFDKCKDVTSSDPAPSQNMQKEQPENHGMTDNLLYSDS
jgi:hypothetical protein